MTTLKATTGTKKATISKGKDGYGDTVFNVSLIQSYNNGLGTVDRFIDSKRFPTERKAGAWAKKQLN